MRVLVTGHQGYIGTVLCSVLTDAGHEVAGLDAGWFAAGVLGPPPRDPASVGHDLRDAGADLLGGVDAVVHLAALSNDPLGDLDPALTYDINHRAAVALAGAARSAGVRRFLFSSSCSVYGATGDAALVDETAPLVPVSHYARSKILVEEDLHRLAGPDFAPTYLRNATVHGVSPRQRTDLVVNDLVASAHLTGVVRVLSDGTPWRPLVHVRDVAGAFLAALEAPEEAVRDVAINVGDESGNVRIGELARIVARVTGAAVDITGETGPDPRSYQVSFDRLRERLPAARPAYTVERSVSELAAAYRAGGLTADDNGVRLRRLPFLSGLRAAGRLDADLRWVPAAAGRGRP